MPDISRTKTQIDSIQKQANSTDKIDAIRLLNRARTMSGCLPINTRKGIEYKFISGFVTEPSGELNPNPQKAQLAVNTRLTKKTASKNIDPFGL